MTDRQRFLRALAEFLAGNVVGKSMDLEAGAEHAKEWQKIRLASPIKGYVTVKEAEKALGVWLGIEPGEDST